MKPRSEPGNTAASLPAPGIVLCIAIPIAREHVAMVSRDAVRCSYAVFSGLFVGGTYRHSGCQLTDLVEIAGCGQRAESHLEPPDLELSLHSFPTTLRRFRLLTQSGSSNSKLFLRRVLSQDDMTTVPQYPLCAHLHRPSPASVTKMSSV